MYDMQLTFMQCCVLWLGVVVLPAVNGGFHADHNPEKVNRTVVA